MANKPPIEAYILAAILLILALLSLIGVIASVDLSGPVLSERNPNGTIDRWYLFDGAYR